LVFDAKKTKVLAYGKDIKKADHGSARKTI